MSWNRNSLALAVACAGLGVAAADAATLVVRSSGPSAKLYPPGKSLADGATLALKATDQVTLLDAKGTRVLRGPGSFPAAGGAAAASDSGTRLAALVGGGGDRRVRIGAVRGVSGASAKPSLWYVDPSRSGTVCVASPTGVTLWRTDAAQDATVAIKGKAESATVQWPAGAHTMPWPVSLPVAAGADYTVTGAAAAPTRLRFAVLGQTPSGVEETAQTLIRNSCSGQLDMLVSASQTAQPGIGG